MTSARWAILAFGLVVTATMGQSHATSNANSAGTSQGIRDSRVWHIAPDHTSSKKWAYVDRLGGANPSIPLRVAASGLVVESVSVNVEGGPVEFRGIDNGKAASPARSIFPKRSKLRTVSFQYVRNDKATTCGHTIRLLWRSPEGRQVHLRAGTLVVNYEPASTSGPSCP